MKINNKFWNTFFKLLFLAFIILLCIYILYFSSIKTVEGFAQECNNCSINPTSGNCIPLYDMSYTLSFPDDGNEFTISFEKIDTNYLFCPYEPNCDGSENYMANIEDQNSRIDTSINRIGESIADITCCSGSTFYDTHLTNYKTAYETNNINKNIIECDNFKKQLHDEFDNKIFTEPDSSSFEITLAEFDSLDVDKKKMLDNILNTSAYKNIVSFCTKSNPNHVNYNNFIDSQDFSGMLFKKNLESSGNILEDPNLTVQEILDYQNILEMSLNRVDAEYNINGYKYSNKETRLSEQVKNLNDQLKRLDLSKSFDQNRKSEIQQNLANLFVSEIKYKTYNYELYNIDPNNIDGNRFMAVTGNYTLNEDEFFDCSGNIQIMNMDPSFNEEIFNPNDDINYFGADINAEYKTQSDLTPTDNREANLLEEDLKYLEQVKPGGTAPVGVINQYLSAINGFYEKQIRTMLGPQIHTVNKQPVFENDNLKIKESTFFVYENDPNNTYECQESVTGNDKFKNCGPPAYYTEFKP